MNRAERRRLEKQTKKKLTDEQYEKFSAAANSEFIKSEVTAISSRMVDDFVALLPEVLRKNRISEERTLRILNEIVEAFRVKREEAFGDEDLSQQRGN